MIHLLKIFFHFPILLKVNSFQILFFPPPLVSNVGLIDMIIDHRTIITDLKEDDYLILSQWNGNTISDASWITSHDLLNYAPHFDQGSLQQMNTRPPLEPRYNLRRRTHPQLQQHAILFLIKEFEKLTIQEVSEKDLSKESENHMGITFPTLPFIN